MNQMTARIALFLFLLWELGRAADCASSHLLRGNQPTRQLTWGLHDNVFYNMVLAADYISVQGDVTVQESSAEGLPYVGYLDAGDALTYRAILPSAGTYRMQIRVASSLGEGRIQLRNAQDMTQTYATIDTLPASGDWNAWETLETTLDLFETELDLELLVIEAGFNLLWLSLQFLNAMEMPTSTPTASVVPAVAPTIEPIPFEPNETPFEPNDACLVSLTASAYTSIDETAQLHPQTDSLELMANSWVTYSVEAPTDGMYLYQMKVMLPSANRASLLSVHEMSLESLFLSSVLQSVRPD